MVLRICWTWLDLSVERKIELDRIEEANCGATHLLDLVGFSDGACGATGATHFWGVVLRIFGVWCYAFLGLGWIFGLCVWCYAFLARAKK